MKLLISGDCEVRGIGCAEVAMASIFDRDDRLLLVDCDCGNIIPAAPSATEVRCHDCERQYRVDGDVVSILLKATPLVAHKRRKMSVRPGGRHTGGN